MFDAVKARSLMDLEITLFSYRSSKNYVVKFIGREGETLYKELATEKEALYSSSFQRYVSFLSEVKRAKKIRRNYLLN